MSIEYTHSQTTASDTWTVVHNLDAYPITDVVITLNGTRQKILPKAVQYVDANTVNILFTEPQIGNARLLGAFKFELEPFAYVPSPHRTYKYVTNSTTGNADQVVAGCAECVASFGASYSAVNFRTTEYVTPEPTTVGQLFAYLKFDCVGMSFGNVNTQPGLNMYQYLGPIVTS
jgi:hypothetical protein